MKRGLSLGILVLSLGSFCSAASAYSVDPGQERQVICLTHPYARKGDYVTQPRTCTFHEHGAFTEGHAYGFRLKNLRWNYWGQSAAGGTGEIGEGDGRRVRVRLTIPYTVCGHTIYTHARFQFPTGYQWGIDLDDRLVWHKCGRKTAPPL